MKKYVIEWAKPTDANCIAKLSKQFEIENCCNGIVADNENYFSEKKIAVAKNKNDIIGYCYCNFETKEKNCSMYKSGTKSFYIEEIFVEKNYRNNNLGQMLYNFIENYAKENNCEIIEVTAVSKDYKKLLSFYIEKLNMNFWSASLIKNLK